VDVIVRLVDEKGTVFKMGIDIPRIIAGIDISQQQNSTPMDFAVAFGSLGWFAIELITMFTNNKRRSLRVGRDTAGDPRCARIVECRREGLRMWFERAA
jgi:hypothetical protein